MIQSVVIQANPVLAVESFAASYGRAQPDAPYLSRGFSHCQKGARAMGGFWNAKFRLWDDARSLFELRENGFMRVVKLYNERGSVWEGLLYGTELDLSDPARTSLEVTAAGTFRTLFRRRYNQTAVTTDAYVSTIIASIVAASGQFIASTAIEQNPTLVNQKFEGDRTAGDLVLDLSRLGDSSYERYLAGVYWDARLDYGRAMPGRLAGA